MDDKIVRGPVAPFLRRVRRVRFRIRSVMGE